MTRLRGWMAWSLLQIRVMRSLFMPVSVGLGTRAAPGRAHTDTEEWQGLAMRTRDGYTLGVVAGVWPDDLLAGRLRVHGDAALVRDTMQRPDGTAVYAIPRRAVLGRDHDRLVL